MEYDYTYSPTLVQPQPSQRSLYLGLFMLTFGIVLTISGLVINQVSRRQDSVALAASKHEEAVQDQVPVAKEVPTTLALLSAEENLGSPALQEVAGISKSDPNQTDSGFAVINTAKTDSSCQTAIFEIGQIEQSSFDHPADEFNWVGALDVLPDSVDPYIVGVNQPADFPWRTNQDEAGNIENNVHFTYTGSSTPAILTVGWSPGTTGQASKLVYLDGEFVGSTGSHSGMFTQGTWQNMPLIQDQVDLSLSTGEHTLTIRSINEGNPTIWDFINLVAPCR